MGFAARRRPQTLPGCADHTQHISNLSYAFSRWSLAGLLVERIGLAADLCRSLSGRTLKMASFRERRILSSLEPRRQAALIQFLRELDLCGAGARGGGRVTVRRRTNGGKRLVCP